MIASPYDTLLDAETRAFVEHTISWYPPDTIDATIEQQRAIYDAMCREFHAGCPAGVRIRDDQLILADRALRLRHYQPLADSHNGQSVNVNQSNVQNVDEQDGKDEACNDITGYDMTGDASRKSRDTRQRDALVVYFHGGGFVVGGLDSHDDVCAELCAATGQRITAVDYRLSPEHQHPAAFEDALAAVRHLAANGSCPLVLCGDSAGGNLAAAVSHATREDDSTLLGQVLIYPGLGGDTSLGSYLTHAEAPMLTTREVHAYAHYRHGNTPIDHDATSAPLRDQDFTRLPPTVVISAECDPLSDDGRHYCEAITAAGGQARWHNEAGLVHGYLRARHTVLRAQQSFERVVSALIELSRKSGGP